MAACSHTTDCALFPMISVNSALKVWRTFYCEGKWSECARFKLSLEDKQVPSNLLPNGKVIELDIAKPAVAKPVKAKTETPGRNTLEEIEEDIATIDLGVPVTAAPAPQPAPGAVPATLGETTSFYLRMQIQPGAGVMTEIIRSLGQSRVRIDAVTEKKGTGLDAPSYLIVLTDQVDEPTLREAVVGLQCLTCVQGDVKRVALEQMANGQLV